MNTTEVENSNETFSSGWEDTLRQNFPIVFNLLPYAIPSMIVLEMLGGLGNILLFAVSLTIVKKKKKSGKFNRGEEVLHW